MAKYKITIPDEGTFQIESDVELTNDEAIQAVYDQMQSQEPKTAGGLVSNVGTDIGNIAKGTLAAAANPLDTTGGIADIATTGAVNMLPKPLVDALFAYEKDPTSMQYKLNQYFKNSPYLDFLYTAPREQYEKMGTEMGKELKELATVEGFTNRMYEKPVTSLLELTGAGRFITTPVKTTKYGGMFNKAFEVADPTQLVTKPAGYAFEKISDAPQIKAAQYAPELEKVKSFVQSGFVIPPSQAKGTGIIKKTTESLLGEKTPYKASQINQQVVNSKIRKFLNVGEDVPLENAMEVISKRTQPIYDEVAKIKPIRVSKAQTVPQSTTGAMREVIELPPKKISDKKTRSGQQILTDLEKQRANTSKLYKDAKNKAARDNNANIEGYKKAESALKKQQKLENELEELASLSGNKDLAARLKDARAERAKGHSIENSIDKGDLNATLFAKQNKKRYVTGEGKEIIDFAEAYPNLVKRQKAPDIIPRTLRDITKQGIEAGLAFQFLGGPLGVAGLYGAKAVTPSLLLGKKSQAALGMADFMPTGSSLLRGLANQPAVTGAAYIPSLLESSDIEDLPYL